MCRDNPILDGKGWESPPPGPHGQVFVRGVEMHDISHLPPPLCAPILDGMENARPSTLTQTLAPAATLDDPFTICSISAVAIILSTMLHEGLGHAAVAIATLHASGTLTSLAWS